MLNLQVKLPPEASQDIARLIASGRYKSVDEVLTAAARNLVTLEEEKAAVELVPLRLTAQIEWSDGQCCAYCPELDLGTAMDTEDEALTDLAEMAVEYAEVYLENGWWDSPNLGQHYLYVLAVASYTTDVYDTECVNKVKVLFERSHDGSI